MEYDAWNDGDHDLSGQSINLHAETGHDGTVSKADHWDLDGDKEERVQPRNCRVN